METYTQYANGKVAPDELFKNVNTGDEGLPSLPALVKFTACQKRHYKKHFGNETPARVVEQRIKDGKDMKGFKVSCGIFAVSSIVLLALVPRQDCIPLRLFCVGSLTLVILCLIGLYGATRLRDDISKDLDALETPAQRILQVYFHGVWITLTICILPISVLLLKDAHMTCPNAPEGSLSTGIAASALAILLAAVAGVTMYFAVRLVTLYEMVQSLQELCCLKVLLSAVLIAIFAVMTNNKKVFFSASFDVVGSQSSWTVAALLWGLLAIPESCFGFIAGWMENKRFLRIHSGMAVLLFCYSLICFPLVMGSHDKETGAIDSQCSSVLNLMGASWLEENFGCAKYKSLDKTENSLNIPVCERVPGVKKEFTAIQWEAGECVISCLDPTCCEEIKSTLFTFEGYISGLGLWFLLVQAVGIWSSRYLYKEIPCQAASKVLHHPFSEKLSLLIGCLAVSGVGLVIGLWVSASFSAMPRVESAELCQFEAGGNLVPENGTIASCSNGILDGQELQIDCGGPLCTYCDTRNPPLATLLPTRAPTTHPTANPTSPEPRVVARLTWGSEDACANQNEQGICSQAKDLDLKLRFQIDNSTTCTVAGLMDVLNRCGGAEHKGDALLVDDFAEETIEIETMVQTLYVFYVENRRMDRPIELSNALLQVKVAGQQEWTNFSLPDVAQWTYDLLGYSQSATTIEEIEQTIGSGNSSTYAFARLACIETSATGVPTIFPCPQYFLEDFEYRVHQCDSQTTCKGCQLYGEASTWYRNSTKVTTCQVPDPDLALTEDPVTASPTISPEEELVRRGWYIDTAFLSSEPRNCHQVCQDVNLTCSEEEMQNIKTGRDCQEVIGEAFKSFCALQDLEYIYRTDGTYKPRIGSIFQFAARDDLAHCVCQKGFLSSEAGSSVKLEKLGIKLNGPVQIAIDINETFVDPGVTCEDPDYVPCVGGPNPSENQAPQTSVVSYHCCSSTSSCNTEQECTDSLHRYIVRNRNDQGNCSSLLAGDHLVFTSENEPGGCVVDKSFAVFMNNFYSGFPDPSPPEFYFASLPSAAQSGIAATCSERSNYATDRRVCFCE